MYKKILLAADFDEVGKHAAFSAKELAKMNNAELFLLHVIDPIPPYAYSAFAGYTEIEEAILKQAKNEMKTLAKEVGLEEDQLYIRRGPIKDEVLTFAKDNNIDLIVVGSHGKRGLSLMLGSKANGILHAAHCNVLIVRKDMD